MKEVGLTGKKAGKTTTKNSSRVEHDKDTPPLPNSSVVLKTADILVLCSSGPVLAKSAELNPPHNQPQNDDTQMVRDVNHLTKGRNNQSGLEGEHNLGIPRREKTQ